MNSNTNNAAAGQKEDYLDKGLDAAEKKFGGSLGQDTQKNRAVNEKIMEPATCSKKPRASTSPTSSPTRPASLLSLDVNASTHPPSTCYEDAHPVTQSPTSQISPRSHTLSKRKHKNRTSVDSTHSHDSFTTAQEDHDEREGEKHGILHKVADGMHKARPYVERLSGTYEPMPKEPEHTK
ncbi:hypothetical protein SVAN01_09749 [Stagonosporopsis vannaccii]|nr:hypothetical protein SVAN01_09749 [Stagonosporopsis vannaccii]